MQVDGAATRRVGGAGLGLAITRALVELKRGSIRVDERARERAPPSPSSCRCRRPTRWRPRHDRAPSAGANAAAEAQVLVADDSPTNVFVLTAMLRSLGLSTVSAADGAEAVEIAAERCPALIFMDIQMPRMDGIAAARQIRSAMPTGGWRSWRSPPIRTSATSRLQGGRVRRLPGEARRAVGRAPGRREVDRRRRRERSAAPPALDFAAAAGLT